MFQCQATTCGAREEEAPTAEAVAAEPHPSPMAEAEVPAAGAVAAGAAGSGAAEVLEEPNPTAPEAAAQTAEAAAQTAGAVQKEVVAEAVASPQPFLGP